MQITRDEFAEAYAARSMLSLPELLVMGMRFVECGCGEVGCAGWQAVMLRGDPNITDAEWAAAERWAESRLGAAL